MKTIIVTSILSFTYCLSCLGGNSDSLEIIQNFELYKKAIQGKNGNQVYQLLDKNTINWYAQILELSKTADSSKISKLEFNDKTTVLAVRNSIPKDSVLRFNTKQFIIYSINTSKIGQNVASTVDVEQITISGTKAYCKIKATPEGDYLIVEFNKESNTWKVDITSIFKSSLPILKKYFSDIGMTENEYIINYLENISGNKLSNSIWYPLIKK